MKENLKPKSNKIIFVSVMQIIAMSIIVISHTRPDFIPVSAAFDSAVFYMQRIALTIFMFSSGWLAETTGAFRKYTYGTYIKKRLVRLMAAYVGVSFLVVLGKFALRLVTGNPESLNLFLSETLKIGLPRSNVLPHLWFLPALMLISLIAPFISKICKNIWASAAVLVAALVLRFLNIPLLEINIFSIKDAKYWLFFFALGIFVAKYVELKKIAVYLAAVGGIASAVALFTMSSYPMNEIQLFFAPLAFLALICGASILGEKYTVGLSNLLGGYTFPIYIISLPVQNVAERVVSRITDVSLWPMIIILYVAGMAVPLAIAFIVKKLESKCKVKVLSTIIGM